MPLADNITPSTVSRRSRCTLGGYSSSVWCDLPSGLCSSGRAYPATVCRVARGRLIDLLDRHSSVLIEGKTAWCANLRCRLASLRWWADWSFASSINCSDGYQHAGTTLPAGEVSPTADNLWTNWSLFWISFGCSSLCADSQSCQTMQQRSALFWPRSGSWAIVASHARMCTCSACVTTVLSRSPSHIPMP